MKYTKYVSLLVLICLSISCYPFPADVTPLNDASYFKTVYSLISRAQKSVYVVMYSIKWYDRYPDSQSNKLINSLISAKKRGVDVRAILDRPFDEKENKENEKVADMLSRSGIKVYLDSEKITTHSKLVIVDTRYVVIGSTNWSYHALTDNNETNVLIDSEQVAKEYVKYFEELASLCK